MNNGMTRRGFMRAGATFGLAAASAGAGLTAGTSLAFAQDADLLADIKKRGFIRVGTFSIPPETWIDISTGEWKGIAADFTKAVAEEIGVEVDPVVLVHSALAPALDSGRIDVISGLYRTAEREKVMAYASAPYWYGIDVLLTRSEGGVATVEDLKDKVIGTVRGSAQEIEAAELQKRYGISDIRKYDAADPMLMDLKAGRLDAAVWWGYTFDYAAQQNPDYDFKVVEYLAPEYLNSETLPGNYYVFSKNGTAGLIQAFDAATEKLKAAGVDKQIMEKYGLSNPSYLTGKF
ncbi:transporter substrate-binding domain-containing protein [Aquamicrobium sp. NLF2-7]|uniref:substrate-binding periplasmic protein n=1 Tax=Aquamicrobium TaxID=69278 RepID=UPI001EFABA8C|nr:MULTISPECIES: transporter substrate-binding domain-containing protein [Aquamicrobium]MCG8272625.1 transporter substrate-binding domain-containing protein [Aquamicrobium sp. NLF2-7]MDH4992321.1 transporter substrate-binding domain-containing protein [Aquamicrobium lusatiense]